MYSTIASRFRSALTAFIEQSYGALLDVVLERPPRLEMGELSTPICFELAKRLREDFGART